MHRYKQLISDTLAYIEQEYHVKARSGCKTPTPPMPVIPVVATPQVAVERPVVPQPKAAPDSKTQGAARKNLSISSLSTPVEELRQIIQKVAPQIVLHREIPSDEKARNIAHAWKEKTATIEVGVLSFGESGQQLAFLENLTTAIDVCLRPARLVEGARLEKENKWEIWLRSGQLKWLIAPSRVIGKSTELTRLYREILATQERFLGETALFFLNPFADYFKNPALKRTLWSTLCQLLQR